MKIKLKYFLRIVLIVSFIFGCEKNHTISKKLNKKTLAETFKTENPVANPDSIETTQNTGTIFAPKTVAIQEDSTPTVVSFSIVDLNNVQGACDSNYLSYTASNSSVVGDVTWSGSWPDCTATFAPSPNANGTSAIKIIAKDGNSSIVAMTFDLLVEPINDPPIMSAIASPPPAIGGTPISIAFTLNDQDGPLSCTSSNLTYSSDDASLVPSVGALTWSGTWPNCIGIVTPAANGSGTANITFTVSDGTFNAFRVFSMTVIPSNLAPVISDIGNQTTTEDSPVLGLAVNISDVDSLLTCATSLTATSTNPSLLPVGSITFSGTAPNCTVNLASLLNQSGTSTVTLSVNDGTLSTQDSFVLTVVSVNDAPSVAAISNKSTNEDTATSAIAVTITDIDGPSQICNNTYLSYTTANTSVVAATGAVAWSGTWPNCTAVITPVANASGTSTIQITANDGTSSSSPQSFILNVNGLNNAPTMAAITSPQSIDEDSTKTVAFTVDDVDGALTCTDSHLQYSSSNTSVVPTSGAVTWSGTWPSCFGTISPVSNSNGTAIITFNISDGTLSASRVFTLNIAPVNDAPSISNVLNQSTNEDNDLNNIAVTITDIDSSLVCATDLSATSSNTTLLPTGNIAIAGTAPNCTVSMSPLGQQNGTTTVTLIVHDGALTVQDSFVLSVNEVNDFPTMVSDGDSSILAITNATASIALATGSDIDMTTNGQNLSYFISGNPTNGTLTFIPSDASAGGSLTYTPNFNYSGSDSFSYLICDSASTPACSSARTVSITVIDVNDAPIDITMSSTSIPENSGGNAQVGLLSTADPDLVDSFNYTLVSGIGDNDNSLFNLNGAMLRMNTSADYESKSSYSVRVRTIDSGGLTTEKAFAISISNVNEAPAITNLSNTSVLPTASTVEITLTVNDVDGPAGSCSNSFFNYSSDTAAMVASSGAANWSGTWPSCTGTFSLTAGSERKVNLSLTVSDGSLVSSPKSVIIVRSAGWEQEAYLKAPNAGASDEFGRSLSLSGDLVAVGAPYEASNQTDISNGTTASANNGSYGAGAVYAYRRSGASWQPEAYIKAANAKDDTYFGSSVSAFGDSIAVGSEQEYAGVTTISNGTTASTDLTGVYSGAVYVYRRIGSNWAQEAYIKAPNANSSDYFGRFVSLNGNTLVVAAHGEDSNQGSVTNGSTASADNSLGGAGAVYVFRRNGTNWEQEAYIKPQFPGSLDAFGSDVAVSGDLIAVGASNEDGNSSVVSMGSSGSENNALSNSGAVYLFRRLGNSWTPEAYVKAANANVSDGFGSSVALSGERLAVAALFEDSAQSTITNGTTASSNNGVSNSGAVYIFGMSSGSWIQEAYIKASNSDINDQFGQSLSLSGDSLAVGAPNEDAAQTTISAGSTASADNSSIESGAVYIFRKTGTNWAQESYLKSSNSDSNDSFGYRVSLTGDSLAVSSRAEDSNQTTVSNDGSASTDNTVVDSGAVYIFRNQTFTSEPTETLVQAGPTDSISVSWSGANGGLGNGTMKVVYGTAEPDANCVSGTTAYEGTDSTASVPSGLAAGQTYYVRICQSNGGTWSSGVIHKVTIPSATAPTVLSITRGTTSNPVPETASKVDFVITFSKPVFNLSSSNLSFTEVSTNKGAQGQIDSIICPPGSNSCTVWTRLGNAGSLRMDLANSTGITDGWNSLSTSSLIGSESYDRVSGWYQESFIKASNAGSTDKFGTIVSISGDTIATSASQEDNSSTTISSSTIISDSGTATNSGAAYIFRRSANTWAQEAYIKPSNTGASDGFAYVSLSGDLLAVGATNEDNASNVISSSLVTADTSTVTDSGAVYIFKRSGSTWAQEAYIKPSNMGTSDYFGNMLELSGDTLAVLAPQEDGSENFITNGSYASPRNDGNMYSAYYVFKRTGTTWTQEAYIKRKVASVNLGCWWCARVALDDDTLTVSSIPDASSQNTITNGTSAPTDTLAGLGSGAVYVYRRTGNRWEQEAYLKSANPEANDWYGGWGIHIDGDTIAIGSEGDDSAQTSITNGTGSSTDNSITDSGAIFVVRRQNNIWTQEAYIKPDRSIIGSNFGGNISLSSNTIIASLDNDTSARSFVSNGAEADQDTSAAASGSVFVFKRTGAIWAQEAKIKVNNNQTTNQSFSVSISGDTLAMGDIANDTIGNTISNGPSVTTSLGSTDSGAVYVFRNTGRHFGPVEMTVSATSSTSFDVNWSAANTGTGTGNFKVVYDSTEPGVQCTSGSEAFNGVGSSVSVNSGLTASATYYVRVCSFDGTSYSDGLIRRIVLPDTTAPSVVSIVRGNTANPVAAGTPRIDFIVNFSEPVVGLSPASFSLSEGSTATGATGIIDTIDCSAGASCTVWVFPGNAGEVRLDFSSPANVKDMWGNAISGNAIGDETYTTKGWYQEAYVKPASAASVTGDQFGNALALSGDVMVVGAKLDDSNQTFITNGTNASTDDSVVDSGAAYIYRRSGAIWVQEAYLKAPNATTGDSFGHAVAVFGDTVAVSAHNEDNSQSTITNATSVSANSGATTSGAVYIFAKYSGSWWLQSYIKPSNTGTTDLFGSSLTLTDGLLAVGAPGEDNSQVTITSGSIIAESSQSADSGAVYVFARKGSNWYQEAYLKASNSGASDAFGSSVALSGDTLAAGSTGEDNAQATITNGSLISESSTISNSGAVYIFQRSGHTWLMQSYIKAANTAQASGDNYAQFIGLSEDTLAVASSGEDSNQVTISNGTTASSNIGASGAGAVYIYSRSGSSWTQQAYIKATNAEVSDGLGSSLALGNRLLAAGATGEDENHNFVSQSTPVFADNSKSSSGAVYLFSNSGATWSAGGYLKASNSDALDTFGQAVALSGNTLAVSSTLESSSQTTITNGVSSSNDNSLSSSGAVYIYRNNANVFDPPELIVRNNFSDTIDISWSTGTSGSGSVSYKVVYGTTVPSAGCSTGTVAYTGTGSSIQESGLNPGTYYVRVCAINSGITSVGNLSRVDVRSDVTSPSITSIQRSVGVNPFPLNSGNVTYTVNFSESVTGVVASNFTFTDSTGIGATGLVQSVDCSAGTSCSVVVTPEVAGGSLRLDLSVNHQFIYDAEGNSLSSGRIGDETFDLVGWYPTAYIKASNNAQGAGDFYGLGLDIDGNTLAVGAYGEDSNLTTITTTASTNTTGTDRGAVYVYTRAGSIWSLQSYIKASNSTQGQGDFFGLATSLSGNRLAVASKGEDSNQTTITTLASANTTGTDSGAVYAYSRSGSTWTMDAYIKASNSGSSDAFGSSIQLHGDTLVVGSPAEDSNQFTISTGNTASADNTNTDSGAVYVYNVNGTTWNQQAYIKAANNNNLDAFGTSLALYGDTLLVSATGEDSSVTTISNGTGTSADNTNSSSGASYVFRRTGTTWTQEAYIKSVNSEASDLFGSSVTISGDTISVAASAEAGNQQTITNGTTASSDNSAASSGAVYIYSRSGSTWVQEAYVKPTNLEAGDGFGTSVALSGQTLVVSSISEDSSSTLITNTSSYSDSNGSSNSGAAYMFSRASGVWSQEAQLKAVNGKSGDNYGLKVSISGDTVAVSTNLEDGSQASITNGISAGTNSGVNDSGAIYVYRNSSRLFEPDIRVSANSSGTITFNWVTSLGNGNQVKVAPAVVGTGAPSANCTDGGSITLTAGTLSYSYSGLTADQKYGFRFCSTNGTTTSEGITIWVTAN